MTVLVDRDFEVHTLPSGETLVYRDRDHSYWRELVEKPNGEHVGRVGERRAGREGQAHWSLNRCRPDGLAERQSDGLGRKA